MLDLLHLKRSGLLQGKCFFGIERRSNLAQIARSIDSTLLESSCYGSIDQLTLKPLIVKKGVLAPNVVYVTPIKSTLCKVSLVSPAEYPQLMLYS